MFVSKIKSGLILTSAVTLLLLKSATAAPMAEVRGSDFQGGGQKTFGADFYGRDNVNMAYAQPTGDASSLAASLKLNELPHQPAVLLLEAMNDDSTRQCQIGISLNGRQLFSGTNSFPTGRWQTRSFSIAPGILHAGDNQLVIANIESAGSLGQPPWFMVARAAIAGVNDKFPAINPRELHVELPAAARPFPEPLPPGHSEPGFKFRGTKGWAWTPEQYLDEIPFLARYKMNFLMNCYISMFTSPSNHIGDFTNEWWKPLPDWKKAAYAKVIRECQKNGITFCFAIHPQLASPRPFSFDRPGDLDDLYQHFAWAQSQGVRWFSVSLDDVSWSQGGPAMGGKEHAKLVNTVINRLRKKDPGAQLIFCPGPYSGDGSRPDDHAYLQALGQNLDPAIYIFWTGDGVIADKISRETAEKYKRVVQHRLFLWDNYPVNDSGPTMHLGPVKGRATDLCEAVDGYMSNPMAREDEINRLPLATCADYSYNPWNYDPDRSIGQAILTLAKTKAQQKLLQELIETYPGFLVTGGITGTNPVRDEFNRLLAAGPKPEAQDLTQHLADISLRLKQEFPGEFKEARRTVDGDIAWMKAKL